MTMSFAVLGRAMNSGCERMVRIQYSGVPMATPHAYVVSVHTGVDSAVPVGTHIGIWSGASAEDKLQRQSENTKC